MYSQLSHSQRLLTALQKNNPFYLISAASMLGGCLAVTNSLSWSSIPLARLLILIGTLNLYEAALIALAVYLIRHRRIVRDGVMLLALEAFFLIDITFLNAEIVTSHLALGLEINVLLFLFAIVKLRFIAGLLGHTFLDRRLWAILLNLAAIFALPTILSWLDNGALSPRLFYLAWWGICLLIPATYAICRSAAPLPAAGWTRTMLQFYLALPWLSLVLHAGILHYVYNVTFFAADSAPLLLGMTFLLRQSRPNRFIRQSEISALMMILPLVALGVSLDGPAVLTFEFLHHAGAWITPEQLALAASYLTYVFCFAPAHALAFLSIGFTAAAFWLLGPTADQWSRGARKIYDELSAFSARLLPHTTQDWGILAIAAAFAFLGIGAAISLARRQTPPPLPPPQEPVA